VRRIFSDYAAVTSVMAAISEALFFILLGTAEISVSDI